MSSAQASKARLCPGQPGILRILREGDLVAGAHHSSSDLLCSCLASARHGEGGWKVWERRHRDKRGLKVQLRGGKQGGASQEQLQADGCFPLLLEIFSHLSLQQQLALGSKQASRRGQRSSASHGEMQG